jgi:hypothetical protein
MVVLEFRETGMRQVAAPRGQVMVSAVALTYIDNNASGIVNYGKRHRCGERISTGFVESTINQLVAKRFVKKQQMRWTPSGAHLLLQIRVQALNDDLHATFGRWYPDLRRQHEHIPPTSGYSPISRGSSPHRALQSTCAIALEALSTDYQ